MESPRAQNLETKSLKRTSYLNFFNSETLATYSDDFFSYDIDPLLPDADDEKQTGYVGQSLPLDFYYSLKILIIIISTLALLIVGIISFWLISNPAVAPDTCQNPITRREWRMLSESERRNYTASVKCLWEKPSKLGLNTSLYDDFVYVHLQSFQQAHKVAASLPWHRYYLTIYENALRETCGYNGHMPYWDWTLDATDPPSSIIWSSSIGFGGDGNPETKCVEDGPFSSVVPQYSYSESEFGPEYSPHCLKRNFTTDSNMHGVNYTQNVVKNLIHKSDSYEEFRTSLEDGAHKYVHLGIGGEMPTKKSSNDPIFFVHHTQIDRLWWLWQTKYPEKRFTEYDGFRPEPEPGSNSTLDSPATSRDILQMFDLAKDVTVLDMLCTESQFLCYKYLDDI